MNYVYDSNILVYKIRGHAALEKLEETTIDQDEDNLKIISIVTKAEMESLASQFGWGNHKRQKLRELLNQFLIVPIDSQQIVDAYVELDTFSQGKHSTKTLKQSSRNTGKNDLWIAATTVVTGSTLVTSDEDFGHFNKTFFEIIKLKLPVK